VHTCNPSYLGGGGRRITFEAKLGKVSMMSYLKNKQKTKRSGGKAQDVELLPSIYEALSSSTSTTNKQTKRKIKNG
jgi:hypothetical protein